VSTSTCASSVRAMGDSTTLVNSAAPELRFATELSQRLGESGACALIYATAEMQPFSNAQKPDLVYTPAEGPYAGQNIFVEIKLRPRHFAESRQASILKECFEFVQEYTAMRMAWYFFVTEVTISDLAKSALRKHRIFVADQAKSVESVYDTIRNFGL
jgi:hypothetical protein